MLFSENYNATLAPKLSPTALLMLGLYFKACSVALYLDVVVKSPMEPRGNTLHLFDILLAALAMCGANF